MMNKTMMFILGGALTLILCVTALYFYGRSQNMRVEPTAKTPLEQNTLQDYSCMSEDEQRTKHFGYCPRPSDLSINNGYVVTLNPQQWSKPIIIADTLTNLTFKGANYEDSTVTCEYELANDQNVQTITLKNNYSINRPESELGNWLIDTEQPNRMRCIPMKDSLHPICNCVFHYQEENALSAIPLQTILEDTPKQRLRPSRIFRSFQQTASPIRISNDG